MRREESAPSDPGYGHLGFFFLGLESRIGLNLTCSPPALCAQCVVESLQHQFGARK